MTRGLDDALLVVVCACIAFLACTADCFGAQAQSRPTAADVADVARCLVAEDERGGDWSAILDVLERRAAAHGMRVASMARAYCAVHRSRSPSARQARILALPGGRPSARLAAVYRRAVDAARAGGSGGCEAEHWGAPTGEDHARALRAGWLRVDCGGVRNAFWRIPRRGEQMSINEGPRSASHFISEVADGALAAQLSGELHRMGQVLDAEGNARDSIVKGEIAVKIKFARDRGGVVTIEYDVKVKEPAKVTSRGVAWITAGGNFTHENPRQLKLGAIRDVSRPAAPIRDLDGDESQIGEG